MKNYIQEGEVWPFTAAATIAAGDLVAVSTIVGVAISDVASGASGLIQTSGVFEVGKETGAIAQGDSLYLKATTKKVTTTSADNVFVGYAFSSALSADTTVQVKINF